MVKRRMSEGANREELSPYARQAPSPKMYHIHYVKFIVHHFYVLYCLSVSANFSVVF